MSTTIAPALSRPAHPTRGQNVRWMISFLGFPLGGLAAWLLTGPVVDLPSAMAGGLLTGAILGAVQAWALRAGRRSFLAWSLATSLGMAAGLGVGSSLVGFATGLTDLAVQGAITGAVVGVAQAAVLWRRTRLLTLVWPAYLALVWALGWTVTTLAGIGVGAQFTVFGASGAIVTAAATSILPLVLRTGLGSGTLSAR